MSNDRTNVTVTRVGRGATMVVPLTSYVSRMFPFQAARPAVETGIDRDSVA
ncbi:hypothetical protein [Pseudactinotalea sp. HY158]|uniref:hypothetical protein n=1 Tax=Pseudactinotalea sp. HY158 TaxID=2654547 RepID=UPI00129C959F|nr:hypothetical protein [Pseudactinotalea sp. HY158]QGH69960.1 hypothetical protein GCE65_10925 [Pseudactinotalea sp. HY158]